jgi:hypothetical protein
VPKKIEAILLEIFGEQATLYATVKNWLAQFKPPVPWTEKKQLKGTNISSSAEVVAAAGTWLDRQPSEFFFLSGLKMLEQRAKKSIRFRWEYVE